MFSGADGNRLAADRWGGSRPETVVLLHGGGQTRGAWGRTAQALADAGWPVVAVDLRGHGESDWCRGRYAVDAFVGDVARVVRALGQPVVLVGASLGGLSSLLAAAENPELPVAGLVLVDVAHRFDPAGAGAVVEFMASRPDGFASPGEAAEAVAAYLPHRRPPDDLAGLRRNLRERDGRWHWHWDPTLLDLSDGLLAPESRPQIEARLHAAVTGLAVRARLVRGVLSDVVTPEIAAEFDALSPWTEVVEVAAAGHMVAGDRNDVFAGAVLDFLRQPAGAA